MADINIDTLIDLYQKAMSTGDAGAVSAARAAVEQGVHAESAILHMRAAEAMAHVAIRAGPAAS